MKRWLSCGVIVWLCGSMCVGVAQEIPQVVQPEHAAYSTAARARLDEGIRSLEWVLRDEELASQRTPGQGGWGRAAFAAYTAGSLERLGYETVLVRAEDGRIWVLVGIELGGTTAWVPVEPVADPAHRQTRLGVVAFEGDGPRFDVQYVAYDAIVELPLNLPPVAVIRSPARLLAQREAAWFGHMSVDPDGEIVLYEWTFPGESPVVSHSASIWHAFPEVGTYTVGLRVTDSRGAQASTTVTVEAKEDDSCGCG